MGGDEAATGRESASVLRIVAWALVAVFVVLAPANLVVVTGSARVVLALVAAASAALLALVAWRVPREGTVPDRVAALIVTVPVVNSLLHVALTRDPDQALRLLPVLVGIGAVVSTPRLLVWLLGGAVTGWLVVAATRLDDGGAAAELTVRVVLATGLAVLVNVVRARREQEVRHLDQRYRQIYDASPVGICLVDDRGRLQSVNPALCELLGRDAGDLVGRHVGELTHPDDTDDVLALSQQAQDEDGGIVRLEARLLRPGGEARATRLSLRPVEGPGGTPWTLAHLEDVTAQREAEATLREREDDLAAIGMVAERMRSSDDVRASIVAATRELATAAMASLVEPVEPVDPLAQGGPGGGSADVGARAGDMVVTASSGIDLTGNLVPAGPPSATQRVFATGEPLFLADAHGSPLVNPALLELTRCVSLLWQPVEVGGRVVGVLAAGWTSPVASLDSGRVRAVRLLAREAGLVLEHEGLMRRLRRQAHRDSLTGLHNRRAWDDLLRERLALARHHGRPVCVALVDLDHFKAYNDRHGHLEGDVALQQVAESLQRALRLGDDVARWGGEEFALALDCTPEVAEGVLERVRSTMPAGQTCSAGLAVWSVGESAEELLSRADQALYAAKQSGRDRVVTG